MTAKHGKLLVSVTAVALNMLLVQVLLQTQCYAQAVWTSLQGINALNALPRKCPFFGGSTVCLVGHVLLHCLLGQF